MSDGARHVLIVEDDTDLAAALAGLLSDDGFHVDLRHDGEAGLIAGLESPYDLIILDVMLPKRNGFGVCQELREHGVTTPLLMLTAKDGELDEVEGLEVGADDFLRKPFEWTILRARIAALLRRHDRDVATVLEFGDLKLDVIKRTLSAQSGSVGLTQREFTVLEMLLSVAPQTVAKGELLTKAWGSDFEGDATIVEVYVGYLRKKMQQISSRASIKTIRQLGYCIVDES